MSALQVLGAVLLSLPFVGVIAALVRQEGWAEAVLAVAVVGATVAIIVLGAALLTGDLS